MLEGIRLYSLGTTLTTKIMFTRSRSGTLTLRPTSPKSRSVSKSVRLGYSPGAAFLGDSLTLPQWLITARVSLRMHQSLVLRGSRQMDVLDFTVLKILVMLFPVKAYAMNPSLPQLDNTSAFQCIAEAVNLRNRLIFKCPEGAISKV